MNLIINARDSIDGIGSIFVSTVQIKIVDNILESRYQVPPGEYMQLIVRDTGSGMNQSIIDNIFEPFYTTKPVGTGTGLGLSTTYGIIKQNLGQILVESTLGEGTTFEIILPSSEMKLPNIEEIKLPVDEIDASLDRSLSPNVVAPTPTEELAVAASEVKKL